MQLLDTIMEFKIKILGDYWDSHIYKGRLYLWTMQGTILVIDWDPLIESLTNDKEEVFALECAFTRGDNLFGAKKYAEQLREQEYKEDFKRIVSSFLDREFLVDEKKLHKFLVKEIENPFKELPTDTEIYKDTIYSIFDNGLSRIDLLPDEDMALDKKSKERLWDCPLLSLKIKNGGRIALSGGDNGLFEYNINNKSNINYSNLLKTRDGVIVLSESHSMFTSWNFSSIYSSSDVDHSYLSAFSWGKNKKIDFVENIYEQEIFLDSSLYLSWGSGDKIYGAVDGGLKIVKFIQNNLNKNAPSSPFNEIKFIPFHPWKGEIINAGASFFGVIVECENALVILRSDNEITNIKSSVVNWRVFPRSVRYENHLHVILEDSIDVYSFNHDYYINQNKKHYGVIKYFQENNEEY